MQRELTAEFVGTFSLVSAVCGSALFSATMAGLVAIAFAVGLSVMAMAFAVGHISGAHFNPAVTCGLVAAGPVPGRAGASLHRRAGAWRSGSRVRLLSCAQRRATRQLEHFHEDFQLIWRWRVHDGCGLPHRNGDHRAVSRGDRRCDLETRACWICTDCNWSGFDHVSFGRDTDIECLAQSGTCDCDSDFRRTTGPQCFVAILGGTDIRWRDRRRRVPLAAGRDAEKERAALGRPRVSFL